MSKQKNIAKNYIFNLIYQIFLIIVPLIVTPYISRVLLPDGIGKYSFSFSLITYFTTFAGLGFLTYGQRQISQYQDDKYKQSKVFYEIVICRFFPVTLSLLINIILIANECYGSYNILMLILSINIIAIFFDSSFFLQGNEEFGKLAIINVLIKACSIVLVFFLVKSPSDVWKYTLINAGMVLVSNLALTIFLPRMLKYVPFKELRPFKHFKGALQLFVPTIATTVYVLIDKTLLGALITDTVTVIEDGVEVIKKVSDLENGWYEQSEKLVKMLMTVITCLGTVMISRNSYEISKGNLDKVKENVYKSAKFVWLIGLPMALGLIAIANNLVPWFYGDGYEKCVLLIRLFCPLILIIGLSNLYAYQYLAPMGYNKRLLYASLIGCLINIVLNLILIPQFMSVGATIASISGEFFVTICMALSVRKEIKLRKVLLPSFKILIAAGVMFAATYVMSFYMQASILNTFLIILVGFVIYILFLFFTKEDTFVEFFKSVLGKIKNG